MWKTSQKSREPNFFTLFSSYILTVVSYFYVTFVGSRGAMPVNLGAGYGRCPDDTKTSAIRPNPRIRDYHYTTHHYDRHPLYTRRL